MARMMSVDLSITIAAAVPRPDLSLASESKSIGQSMIWAAGSEPHRRSARDDREQIVPAAAHPAAVPVDQLAERNRHRLLDIARLVDVTREAEDLGAGIVGRAETREP